MNISPLTHAFASAAGSIKKGFSFILERTSFPVIIGTPETQYKFMPDDAGRSEVLLRNAGPWTGSVTITFPHKSFPSEKVHKVMVPTVTADKMESKQVYLALCSPIHMHKDAKQRSLLLPVLRIW